MRKIMANVSKILFKRKGFVIVTFILPLVMVFVFSAIYGSNSTYKIGIINKDEGKFGEALYERLNDIENIEIVDIEEDEGIEDDLIFQKYVMLVEIKEDYTNNLLKGKESKVKIESINQSEIESVISSVIESESRSFATISKNIDVETEGIDSVLKVFKESMPEYNVIEAVEKSESINNSLGIMIYLIFLSAAFSTVFLIEDERQGTKDRILMGKVSEQTYFGAMCLIFFLLSSVAAIEYYIICHISGYDFGFKNTFMLLIILLLIVLLSVVFNVLLTTLIKKKGVFNICSTAITIPVFMLSGSFWPNEMMSEGLQKISSILPPRWCLDAVEKLQAGKGIVDIIPQISGLIILSIFLFLLSIFFTRNKIVLVKENK